MPIMVIRWIHRKQPKEKKMEPDEKATLYTLLEQWLEDNGFSELGAYQINVGQVMEDCEV